jgi:hypothetical protein
MKTIDEFLCEAFSPPKLTRSAQSCPADTRGGISGRVIKRGYPISAILSKATANIADTFRVPASAWISEEAARLFKANTLMRGNLMALPGRGLRPFVALSSATVERPTWRDLLRTIEIDIPVLAIITANHKRRLWPAAKISHFGRYWRPLFVVGDEERSLCVNAAQLRKCAQKAIRAVGIFKAQELEAALKAWRRTDEFLLALFVAQKNTEVLR